MLTFDVSYKHYSPTDIEKLRVLISTNCGTSYTEVFMKEGADLAIDGTSTSSEWAPTSAAHWRNESIDLSAYVGSDITIKFETTNDYGNNLYIDNVNVSDAALTKLSSTSCNKNLTSMDDALYSDAVPGATNYRYLVEHAATGYSAVSTRGSANNLWRASWLVANPLKYGTTYTVKVAAFVNGSWAPYSTSCNITTPATKLDASSCGKALTSLDEKLYSLPVAGATNYRYEVRKKGDNSLVAVSYRGSNSNLFQLTWMTSNLPQNNTAYAIRVSAYVSGAWQAYGPVCYVVTPTTTKLASGSCDVSIPTLGTALYSEPIVGATDYRYEVRKESDNSLLAVSTKGFANNLWKMTWIVSNPPQLNGT